MTHTPDVRIMLPEHKEILMAFAKRRLGETLAEPMEREMASWTARWRAEALDHYLPLGWSFGCFQGDELLGFVLGQPLVFFRGHTQTLWIEHLEATDQAVNHLLLETAHRWARDKHFQCVFAESVEPVQSAAREWPQTRALSEAFVEIKSARY